MIDDYDLASPFDWHEFQPELLLDCSEQGSPRLNICGRISLVRTGGSRSSVIWQVFQANIEFAPESRSIDDRAPRNAGHVGA